MSVADAPPRVLPGLLRGEPDPVQLALAERRGADPNGTFCAAVLPGAADPRWTDSWAECAQLDGRTILLAQVADPATLRARLGAAAGPIGLGLARVAWAGAQASCVDALQAHELADRRGVDASFGDDWVAATLLAARDRLADTCAQGEQVAARSAHLADAVRAFAANGLSVVAAARALHVHPNTVIYRLDRWQRLTGWDARSYPGLAKSMACLEAAS
ncbi:MAG: helix-turn-helix domain-containing protein [Mycobacteriales bacterium]